MTYVAGLRAARALPRSLVTMLLVFSLALFSACFLGAKTATSDELKDLKEVVSPLDYLGPLQPG